MWAGHDKLEAVYFAFLVSLTFEGSLILYVPNHNNSNDSIANTAAVTAPLPNLIPPAAALFF